MKTLVLAATLLTTLTAAPAPQSGAVEAGTWTARLQDTWTRNNGERWISIQLEHDTNRRFGTGIKVADLEGLGARGDDWTSPGEVQFALRRDAGTVQFRGRFEDGRGAGMYRFTPNADYLAAMNQSGLGPVDADDAFRLALHDVSRAFVQEIKGLGYADVDLDDLLKMRIHGVSAEYITAFRTAGYPNMSIPELVKTRIHGATPTFVRAMQDAGYGKLDVDELVKMRIHGVTPDYIREMRDLGFKDLPLEELVRFRIHGVTPTFVKELRALGYSDLTAAELVKMRIHGVTPNYIREMRELGYGTKQKVTPNKLVEFRIHGVTPEFVKKAADAGFNDLEADELVDLSIHGRRWLNRRR